MCRSLGTGKSFLIRAIEQTLNSGGAIEDDDDATLPCCVVLAPTGVAALNIGGSTIHSALRLSTTSNIRPLGVSQVGAFRRAWRNVRYIIIDERSMMGSCLLRLIDSRLRELTDPGHVEPFAGLTVVLVGDHYQLPPVSDLELHVPPVSVLKTRTLVCEGHELYQTFDKAFVLSKPERQTGGDQESERFRLLLDRLRSGDQTVDDWQKLMSRRLDFLPAVERVRFDDAIRLYATKAPVFLYNNKMLTDLGVPVARINSVNSCTIAAQSKPCDAGGLETQILLAPGARVMLTANLSVRHGLVNGSLGWVHNIVYGPDRHPPGLPAAVLVRFDDYHGRGLDTGEDVCIVPVTPIRREWIHGNVLKCARVQLPLVAAYAMTIHKAQGSTLPKVVIDIGRSDFASGLSYVGYSRTRTLRDIAIVSDYAYSRLPRQHNSASFHHRRGEDQRLAALPTHRGGL